MQLPFNIPPELILLFVVLAWLQYSFKQREIDQDEEGPTPKAKIRGRGMDYSAGRDAAQQNARFQQAFVPMEPDDEAALRDFYLGTLGLIEMRAPNYPKDVDGFWAVSGTRQIYFGTQPSFPVDMYGLPSFPIARIEAVAEQLEAAGHEIDWDTSVPYVKRLIVTDPAGNKIALIRG